MVPEGFVEIRAEKKRIYVKRAFAFLSEYLTGTAYPWTQRRRTDAHTPAYQGRGQLYILDLRPRMHERAVIKHYQRGGLFRFLFRDLYCQTRRFFRELHVVERARALGIPTAEILALVVDRSGFFFYRADLVTMEIPESMNLADYLDTLPKAEEHPDCRVTRQQILVMVSSLLRKMHHAGIYHADLNLKNILVKKIGDTIEGYIIDLDRARYQPLLKYSQRVDNLLRLYRSLEKMGYVSSAITQEDLHTFVELYCDGEPELAERCRMLLIRSPFSLRVHRFFWRITGKKR